MSNVPPPPPPHNGGRAEGERLRDAALRLLRVHRAALVRRIQRAYLRHLLDTGPDTPDPVRELVPIPPGIDARVVGGAVKAIADDGLIVPTGNRKRSRRPKAHARKLDVWAIRDCAAAERWLLEHLEFDEPDAAADDPAGPFTLSPAPGV
jgi:hypothetical protein